MFRIHNRRLFWRLAGRSIRANLSRHLLTVLAVFLSTVMLFSIFTIGVNYFRCGAPKFLRKCDNKNEKNNQTLGEIIF